MIKDDSGSEELILGIGALIAVAVLLIVAFSLFRATLPADRSVALQSAASEISGDIATVASASVPYSHAEQYSYSGTCLTVSSDYVTALDSSGDSFASSVSRSRKASASMASGARRLSSGSTKSRA